jgi:hypothetical protein
LIQGTPTGVGSQTFTVTVTDARGASVSRAFTLAVDPPVPTLAAPTIPTTLTTRQSYDVSVTLSAPNPSPITGQLKLTFSSSAEVPVDDPMTQFSTGTRSVNFTVPAGTTTAVFGSKITLLTGTVAGSVRLSATIDNGPADVPVTTVNLPAVPPQITDVTAVRTAGGLDVQITAFATSRRVSSVEFSFDIKNGSKTQNVTVSRDVDTQFADWYRNAVSIPFGSAFSFLQSFTIQGADPSAIQSLTVRLRNAQGSTASNPVQPR